MALLTSVQLEEIFPGVDAKVWLGALNDALIEWEINSPQRMAAFLAQIAHESRNLQSLEENLRYSAKRLREVWPKRFPDAATAQAYAGNPEKLANRVYAGRLGNGDEASGDGWTYRGRGLIQLTGRSNYASCTTALGVDLIRYPDRLLEPDTAARSAAWFWSSRGLNQLADHEPGDEDEQDFARITTIINGGKTGLSARMEIWERTREALNA